MFPFPRSLALAAVLVAACDDQAAAGDAPCTASSTPHDVADFTWLATVCPDEETSASWHDDVMPILESCGVVYLSALPDHPHFPVVAAFEGTPHVPVVFTDDAWADALDLGLDAFEPLMPTP
jgi:hypothetical protein